MIRTKKIHKYTFLNMIKFSFVNRFSLCLIWVLFVFCVKVYPFVVKTPHHILQGKGFWVVIKKENESITKIEIEWLGERIVVQPDKIYKLLLGAGLDQEGKRALKVKVFFENKTVKSFLRFLIIRSRHFPKRYLKVAPRMVYPPKRLINTILRQQKKVKKILSVVTPKKFYTFPFISPLKKTKVILPFGVVRIFNQRKISIHRGVDLRAPFNTLVRSSNYGKVVFVGDLYFGGKTVIIDHGLGVFTIYMHLNRILIKKGEMVKKGSAIGLSGMTGRATGPHLHFGLSILGSRVDPLSVIKL